MRMVVALVLATGQNETKNLILGLILPKKKGNHDFCSENQS
jgi:hypothetical protein